MTCPSDMAQVISGRRIADEILEETKHASEAVLARRGSAPKLAMIIVGHNAETEIYVRNKTRALLKAGIEFEQFRMKDDCSEVHLCITLDRLANDQSFDAIMVQLPLPETMNAANVLNHIPPAKDADGLTNASQGAAWTGEKGLRPCTAMAVTEMLVRSGIELRGQKVCIVGRSRLVGMPLAGMLTRHNATVTLCHRQTRDLAWHMENADILVTATGEPNLMKGAFGDWTAVVDVGITRLDDGRIVGDCDPEVAEMTEYITPVPGGVGPVTVACLAHNTAQAAIWRING